MGRRWSLWEGRYHYYRLHPFSLGEMGKAAGSAGLDQLLQYGGFPEPLLKADKRFHRRWLREQGSRVLYEDVRELERVREVSRGNDPFRPTPATFVSAQRFPDSIRSILAKRIMDPRRRTHESCRLPAFARNWSCRRLRQSPNRPRSFNGGLKWGAAGTQSFQKAAAACGFVVFTDRQVESREGDLASPWCPRQRLVHRMNAFKRTRDARSRGQKILDGSSFGTHIQTRY